MSLSSPDPRRPRARPGKRRFRAPAIILSTIAIDAPDVGLVTSNITGVPQLHRWDTRSGELTQLTFEPGGRLIGRLSPDGRWVVWLRDTAGDEIGHWVAIPSTGGEPSTSAPTSRRTPPSSWHSVARAAGSGSSRRRTTG